MPEQVLIAGAGPTGLTAALELSRLGIPVRIIERLVDSPPTSRAIGVQARTLELLEQRGLSEDMVRLGNRGLGVSVYGDGKRIFRLDLTRIDSRYNHLLLISEAETERILRTAIEKQGVSIERGVELIALAQDALTHDPAPVKAVLRHQDGRLEQARASWLISAEGAHSTVRATLDLPFEGKTRDESYALGDVEIDGDLADTDIHIFASEHGFLGLFPLSHTHFRLIASHPISTPSKDTKPALDELQAIYDQRSHIPARLRNLGWSSWFHINSRMVPRLKVGRLLLGGDAAHIHSPAGGQGMNTGIQDMINVCWKLALVLKGQASPALLDTYEQERLAVMRDVLTRTEGLTDLIGSENTIVRSLFNHVGPWIGGAGVVQETGAARMSQIAISYRGGPLSANHAPGGSLHAGDRVPDLPVRYRSPYAEGWTEAALFNVLDPSRFTLIATHSAESTTDLAGLLNAMSPWRDLFNSVVLEPAPDNAARTRFQAVFGKSESVYLIRPDAYVGFAGGEHAAERHLEAYCRKWLTVPG